MRFFKALIQKFSNADYNTLSDTDNIHNLPIIGFIQKYTDPESYNAYRLKIKSIQVLLNHNSCSKDKANSWFSSLKQNYSVLPDYPQVTYSEIESSMQILNSQNHSVINTWIDLNQNLDSSINYSNSIRSIQLMNLNSDLTNIINSLESQNNQFYNVNNKIFDYLELLGSPPLPTASISEGFIWPFMELIYVSTAILILVLSIYLYTHRKNK